VRNVFDAPARRAEGEDIADARLVDHLFVELTDATATRCCTDHEHAEKATIRDGAAARHRETLGSRTPGQRAGDAIPDDAWP
jgi:hypothetical protein